MDLFRDVVTYGLLGLAAVFAVLLVGAGLMQGLVRLKRLLGGHIPTDDELAAAKVERDAKHDAKKAELQARLAEAKARRRSA